MTCHESLREIEFLGDLKGISSLSIEVPSSTFKLCDLKAGLPLKLDGSGRYPLTSVVKKLQTVLTPSIKLNDTVLQLMGH